MKRKFFALLLVLAILGVSSYVLAGATNDGHRLYDSGGAVVGCKTPGTQCKVNSLGGGLNVGNIVNSSVGK